MNLQPSSITFDATDARRVAEFWSGALGAELNDEATAEFAQVVSDGWTLCFARVPEAKAAKNRVHIDLTAGDVDAEVARLETLGATVHATHTEGGRWTTMLDVEGNEFCVVAA